MARSIRNFTKLRHWKQRFSKNAGFIWRRGMTYAGEACEPGDMIPKALEENKTKLRRFWEAGIIELAEFDAPNVVTGQVEEPNKEPDKEPDKEPNKEPNKEPDKEPNKEPDKEPNKEVKDFEIPKGVTVEKAGGYWFIVTVNGEKKKVNGQKALDKMLAELNLTDDEWLD